MDVGKSLKEAAIPDGRTIPSQAIHIRSAVIPNPVRTVTQKRNTATYQAHSINTGVTAIPAASTSTPQPSHTHGAMVHGQRHPKQHIKEPKPAYVELLHRNLRLTVSTAIHAEAADIPKQTPL